MPSQVERDFVRRALGASLRLDQRSLDDLRPLKIEFDPQLTGRVIVSLGGTKVLAIVSAKLVRPIADRPLEGSFSIFVEFASAPLLAQLEGSSVGEEEAQSSLQRMLERIFKASRAVDLESLCVLPSEKVWAARLEVSVLEDDGSVLDAASLASLAALLDFRRPDVSLETIPDGMGERTVVRVFSTFERHPLPLGLHFHPITVSFGLFDIEGDQHLQRQSSIVAVLDPTALEENVAAGRLIFSLTRQGDLVTVQKIGGGIGVEPMLIHTECLGRARTAATKMSEQLNISLQKILKERTSKQ